MKANKIDSSIESESSQNASSTSSSSSSSSSQVIHQMIAGGVAGSTAKTITAPLSRLTILYQVGFFTASSSSSSLSDASNIKLPKPNIKLQQTRAVYFSSFPCKELLSSYFNGPAGLAMSPFSSSPAAAGPLGPGLSGAGAILTHDLPALNARALSLSQAFTTVLRSEGIASLWKGNLTSVLHRFPYSGNLRNLFIL